MKQLEFSYIAPWTVNCKQECELPYTTQLEVQTIWHYLVILKMCLVYGLSNSLVGIYSTEMLGHTLQKTGT